MVGLLLSLFIGGAVRVFFSPQQISGWLEQALRQRDAKVQVQFQSAEISLAKGWWPRVGIYVDGITLQAKDACANPAQVTIDRLYLPLSLSRLIQKQVSFRRLIAENVEVSLLASACETAAQVTVAPSSSESVSQAQALSKEDTTGDGLRWKRQMEKFDQFVSQRWPYEMENARKWLDQIRIERLHVNLNPERSFELQKLKLQMNDGGEPIEFTSQIVLSDQLRWQQPLSPIRFRMELTPEMARFSSEATLKEGLIQSKGHLLLASQQFELKSEVKHIPASHVFEVLNKMQVLKEPVDPKLVWLSCLSRLSGRIEEWRESSLDIQNCSLIGDVGEVVAERIQLNPWSNGVGWKPFTIEVKDLALKKLIHSLGRIGPSGVLSDFGRIAGKLEVTSFEEMKFTGQIRNLEAMFSRYGQRGHQRIPSVQGELHLNEGRFTGLIDQIKLDQGEFKGVFSFNVAKDFREGLLQLKVDHLEVNPIVQKLLVGEELAPLGIYGQAKMEDGQIVRWRGDVGVSEVQGDKWSLAGVKLRGLFDQGRFSGRVQVSEAKVEPQHGYHEVIRPLYLGRGSGGDPVQLTRISGDVEFDRRSGKWRRFQARDKGNRVIFASSGEWVFQGPVHGLVSVDFPELKLLEWDLSGNVKDPRLLPSAKMLKQMARKNPELNRRLKEYQARVGLLPASLSDQKMGTWKELGKKVIETAIKVIPDLHKKDRVPQAVSDEKREEDNSPGQVN